MTALSTPPASQGGKPAQDQDIYPPAVPHGCSRVREIMTTVSTARGVIKSQGRISKRPLGRLPKAPAAQSLLQCTQCSKTFSKQSRLREHEDSHMRNGSAAICLEPRCNKVYGRHADLARHQRSVSKRPTIICLIADNSSAPQRSSLSLQVLLENVQPKRYHKKVRV